MHARNLHRIRPVTRSLLFGAGVALLATGCLDRNGGQVSTGFVGLTTTDGTTTAGASSSTTLPGIMTSTFEPVDTTEDGTTDDTASTGTTGEPIPAGCGNGKLDEGEHCDDGEGNGDDAPCTSACTLNVCGDGYVLAGKEVCDDGPDNGKYEHCAADCQDLGARCGDAVLQMEDGEECDGATPADGCLRDCKLATTCIEIMDSWGDEVSDGVHIIHRGGDVLQVWCSMEADGGGYTTLKYAATDPDNPEYFSAKKAEQRCGEYGMRLVVPRSEAHLASIAEAASAVEFGPANNGLPNDTAAYLRLFGIYPYQEGESCVGVPFNSDDCPEDWLTKDGSPYWLTDVALDPNQPSTQNCFECSMEYFWDKSVPPKLTGYSSVYNGGTGPQTTHFLCEIGDKIGP